MKRRSALLFVLLAASLLVMACTLAPSESETSGSPVTLATFLADDEFDAMNKGIVEGSDLPTELFYATADGYADTITDQSLIAIAWDRLCNVTIETDNPSDKAINDAGISFTFTWEDGRSKTFGFSSLEFFEPRDGELYTVCNPSVVKRLMTTLEIAIDSQRMTDAGITPVELGDGQFSWDADGDGVEETFWFEFIDNGDEARSLIAVTCADKDFSTGWIDGAYELIALGSGTDDQGPFLLVTYYAGDYYSHDTKEICTLRLVDGQLTVIEQMD